jgi:hypothetical protein
LGVVRSVGLRLTSLRPLDRRHLALVGVFLSTRLVMAFLAGNTPLWGPSGPAVAVDVYLYRDWGTPIVASGGMPYSEVPIEYPPGILPFVLVPAWLLHQLKVPFLLSFVVLMTVVDGLGLLGLQRLGRRWGSDLGAWLWVVALPLLGPIVLLRLDLVPAVATIWCLERAAAGRWTAAGAFLGFGCLAKVYPVFLLPAAIVIAPQRRRLIQGALAVGFLGIAPLVGSIRAMTTHVAGYHADRGIQIESLWGNLLLLADRLGYDATVRPGFGSPNITAGIAGTAKTLSTVLSLAVIGFVIWVARRSGLRGDPRYLAATFFATLALLLVTGRVLSPQYLIWLLALAAAAAHLLQRRTMALLLTAILLTHLEFPFRFFDLLSGEPVSLAVLTLRNACLITLAFYAVRAWLAASGTQSAGGSYKRQLTVAMSRSFAGQRPDDR